MMEKTLNDNPVEEVNTKKRGFLLADFLVLILVANVFTAYLYFTHPELIMNAYPRASVELIYFLGLMCAVNVMLAVGIFIWRKWAVYGLYTIVGIGFIVKLYLGLGIGGSIIGLVGGLVVFLLTRNKFHHFF